MPVLRIERHGDRRSVRDLTLYIRCKGIHDLPDNAEAMLRNAAQALAVDPGAADVELFALTVARYCSTRLGASRVSVAAHERTWGRLDIGGRAREADLVRGATPVRVARVTLAHGREQIAAGFRDLQLLTPLPRGAQRVDVLRLRALWHYGWAEVPYDTQWHQVRRVLTEAYAESDRERADLAAVIAHAILAESPAVDTVQLRIERTARMAVDMTAFGLENTGALYGDAAGGRFVQEVRVRRDLPA
jgi:urate oxidase